jgi:hypothetical protein
MQLPSGHQLIQTSPYGGYQIAKPVATSQRAETKLEMYRKSYNAEVMKGNVDPKRKPFYQWYEEQTQDTSVIEVSPTGDTRVVTGKGKNVKTILGLPSKTEESKVRSQGAAGAAALAMIRELVRQTKDNPEIIGFAGATARTLDRAYEQARAFGKKLGDTASIDRKRYSHIFKGWKSKAAESAAFQSRAIQLAYTMARALDPSGRLSDFDVEVQLRSMALRSGSPTQLAAALTAKAQDVVSTYTTAYKAVWRKDAPQEKWMDLSDLTGGGYKSPEDVRAAYQRKEITLEEASRILQQGF